MGTRSLTFVCRGSKNNIVTCMYRQMDGYPSGHGSELFEFLKDMHIVNGLGSKQPKKIANGVNCLAAQLVSHFKDGPGEIYLHPSVVENCGQDYEYYIVVNEAVITVSVVYPSYDYSNDERIEGRCKELFKGDVTAFGKFCASDKS